MLIPNRFHRMSFEDYLIIKIIASFQLLYMYSVSVSVSTVNRKNVDWYINTVTVRASLNELSSESNVFAHFFSHSRTKRSAALMV